MNRADAEAERLPEITERLRQQVRLRGTESPFGSIAADALAEIERLREGLKIASTAVESLHMELGCHRQAANEHRNAAMEADLRTQAAVRGEKQALAEVDRLRAAGGDGYVTKVVTAFMQMRDRCSHYHGIKDELYDCQCKHRDNCHTGSWCAMDRCPLLMERARAERVGWD